MSFRSEQDKGEDQGSLTQEQGLEQDKGEDQGSLTQEQGLEEVETSERRLRKLTEKGEELFETNKNKYVNKLSQIKENIKEIIRLLAEKPDAERTVILQYRYQLSEFRSAYETESNKYIQFLISTNTEDSLREKEAEIKIRGHLVDNVEQVMEEIKFSIQQQRWEIESARSSDSHTSSVKSNVSSRLAKQKAKSEAAKATLAFKKRQIEIIKQKAVLEEEQIRTRAAAERRKTELEADIELLDQEKDAFVSKVEYDTYRTEIEKNGPSEHNATFVKFPVMDKTDQTEKYVQELSRAETHHLKPNAIDAIDTDKIPVKHEVIKNNHTVFNPNSPPFVPAGQDLARYLMKKDLMVQRLSKFDDCPENFSVWRSTFRSVVDELCLNPSEEFDLLLKWLGPESRKSAVSLRAANTNDPAKGIERHWYRLHERYGSPEMVEFALKKKLEKFPRLGNRDNKRLFELSDILSEIESCMDDPRYSVLLSYFNSSSGVLPIVTKLPYHLQSKWMSQATRYKKGHDVTFPPFSVFCEFVREMSSMLNDPGLAISTDTRDTGDKKGFKASSAVASVSRQVAVNVRKTDVKESESTQKFVSPVNCPIHNMRHSLNQCRTFKNKTMADRKKFLRENRMCYKCCETDTHIFKNCTASVKCEICGSERHPAALHPDERQAERNQSPYKAHGREAQDERQAERNQAPYKAHGREAHNEQTDSKNRFQEKAVASFCTNICGKEFGGRSCAKIVPVKVYPGSEKEKARKMYAILDDQSNRTLARPTFFDAMEVSSEQAEPYTLVSCAGTYQTEGRYVKGLTVSAIDDSVVFPLPDILECDEIPNTRSEIPSPEISRYHRHLKDVAIPDLDPEADILLLIGRDLPEAHHIHDQRIGPRSSPFAQKLSLGWVIVGDVCVGKSHKPDIVNVMKTRVLEDGRPTIFPQCNYKFEVKDHDRIPIDVDANVFATTKYDNKPGLSTDDKEFLKIMDSEFKKNEDGHWSAPLPFREPRPRLPNNKPQALKRALALDSNLKRDPKKRQHFQEFMDQLFQNGHAEVARPLEESEERWYLPVFGVYHPKKKDQIRAVFDSSAKFEGLSLNNVLLSGPDLANSLIGVLMRFREKAVAITGDIQQMFYQFHVHESNRNFLRFLWYKDNDIDKELIEYRMCVHVFGNSPSPAAATYGLRKIAQMTEQSHGRDVKDFIDNNFYVDDGLASLPSTEEAVSLMKRTQEALSTGGKVRLHKIASNDKRVLNAFPEEDLEKNLKTLDLSEDNLPTQRSLGLSWDLENDCFVFQVADQKKPLTKRGVLSTVNSLYDPLGFLAPVTLGGRLLLRKVTDEVDGWDEPLPENLKTKWETWVQSLSELTTVSIPRTYFRPEVSGQAERELHVFCDASEKAIAAVAFLKTTDEAGKKHIGFVLGKSKVAPKHGHTIPRLELCAAVLGVTVAEIVSEELALPNQEIKYHTDSKVVLGYLQNKSRRFYIYVENRVSRILQFSTSDQWHYIATEKNPADYGTRFQTPNMLPGCPWITGQSVKDICTNDLPSEQFSLVNPDSDNEVRPQAQVCKTVIEGSTMIGTKRFEKFSDWQKLVNAISLLMHVGKALKSKTAESSCQGWHLCKWYKTVKSHNEAKNFIIKQFQHEAYSKEILCLRDGKPLPRDSSISTLSPYLDEDGILRVGGRLKNADLPQHEKKPVLIPGHCHLATLLVRHYHQTVFHQGRHFTEGAVRAAGYWIIGGKRLINFTIHKCVKCRRLRGQLSHQMMSDLPADRVTPSPPFSFVGIDVFGPWHIVTRQTRGGAATSKRWAVLFICQTTRAIHLELIEEMSSSCFINALRRFSAIRGKVKEFRSDRGTNFVGSTDELKIDAICVENDPVHQHLYNSGTVWRFNTPHSSHMGGSWERLIGVTRRVLDSVLMDNKGRNLSHEILSTFMAEVMAIVNARPLVPVSSDPDAPFILTPATLLTQKTDSAVESFKHVGVKDAYRAQWKHVQFLSDIFWSRWRCEYLQTIQERQKWKSSVVNICSGDVVLLRDKTVSRNEWPLGVVIRTFPSDDGLVRKTEIRVVVDGKPVNYIRPVTEIVKLL
ncbi:uncharacterized protein LOC128243724 isoform X1 [Mya arenaria]|uniref:uncharacterized protein LOC128243724 isoform X1 n=1 Tax=Mya arenaria TaxID=6604 RepID=UPI0022E86D48|nr:uncharacterized protein LOC128243724 isoform X1 [Mya arenaria]